MCLLVAKFQVANTFLKGWSKLSGGINWIFLCFLCLLVAEKLETWTIRE
jgi:hypothetical protein